MNWLRCLTLAVLLVRIAAGAAWAMPWVEAAAPHSAATAAVGAALPCHLPSPAAQTPADADAVDAISSTAPTASAHCALCFSALTMAWTVHPTPFAHSQPVTGLPLGTPWQPLPELRPPI